MKDRIPAITRTARAQRRADVLARCISAARTPEEAERFRRGYQDAAARAASLTRTDIPATARRQVLLGLVSRHRQTLSLLAVLIAAEVVFINTAPAWLQNDVRLVSIGLALGALAMWLLIRYAPRHTSGYAYWSCDDDY